MKKNEMKISLSTFFLLIAIIVILVLGYFVYKLTNDKQQTASIEKENVQASNINSNIKVMSNEIKDDTENKIKKVEENEEKQENVYTYSALKGTYEFMYGDYDAWYKLALNEDGTFIYSQGVFSQGSVMGNYIIDGNNIILNILFGQGGDVGVSTTSGKQKLIIDSNNTIIDNSNSQSLQAKQKNIDLSKVILTKKSSKVDSSLIDILNNSISERAIYVGGQFNNE